MSGAHGGGAITPFWDERYSAPGYLFGEAPNRFLHSQAHLLKPGWQTLAVADGESRNGVWLAAQGLQVHAVDGSAVAQDKARALAARQGVAVLEANAPPPAGKGSLRLEVADLFAWEWPPARYDLAVAIFIQFAPPAQRPRMIEGIKQSVKPGGLLILQGYTPKQVEYKTGGPSDPAHLYTEAMLREWFGSWDILHLREHEDTIEEGAGHAGRSALIDLVARKPGA